MSLIAMLEELASRYPQQEPIELPERTPHCYTHSHDEPCPQCVENKERGYSVMQLAGRCADGFEGGHGVRWHAVRQGEYKAICGATYGRRSAGWSSYEKVGQEVTCPKCQKKLQKALSLVEAQLTQLAPDAGDSAASSGIVQSSALSTSQAESAPTQRG